MASKNIRYKSDGSKYYYYYKKKRGKKKKRGRKKTKTEKSSLRLIYLCNTRTIPKRGVGLTVSCANMP